MAANGPQPIRGMNDVLPEDAAAWQHLERTVQSVLASYGYGEIRLPLVERTELFARSIGETTDVVEKEMYTFEDRGGESISLRPEGTASCVRAAITNGMLHNQQQRLWYAGPMFRYERPQKGRYRQFHQIGAEAFGFEGPDIDAELILASHRIWQQLGLDGVSLQLNSLGTPEVRARYREALLAYLEQHREALDADSQRRLESNPMRVLDSKDPGTREIVADAPSILDHLDDGSRAHLEGLRALLDAAGVEHSVNPRLVRGLDYYTRTVFEWIGTGLGAQDAVCSGGRYDGLVEQLGGRPTPAIGWALGVERLVAMLQDQGLVPASRSADVYILHLGAGAEIAAVRLAERLRDDLPGLRIVQHVGGGSMKSQMKRADRSGARLALILGEDEVAAGTVTMKHLREDLPQESLAATAVAARIGALL